MNTQARYRTAVFLLAVCLGLPPPARACLTALPRRPDVHVRVADETAVIVWDARTQTEHFIRHATFETNAADFGFLVPTPTPPALAAADAEAFERLDTAIQPRLETRTVHVLQPTLLLSLLGYGDHDTKSLSLTRSVATVSAPPVSVLSTWRVGRYDATVLKASDAGALARWLNGHGYGTRPAMRDWLRPYVAGGWAVTAFKIAKDRPGGSGSGDSEAASSVVRMSFHTPHPFFPYQEPADQRTPGVATPPRLLRVFLLSDQRLDAGLGQTGTTWPGRTVWSARLPEAVCASLPGDLSLPTAALPPGLKLTAFEDHSSPRPGTADLYFRPAPSQSDVLPPPVIYRQLVPVPLPLDLLLGIGLIGAWAARRARRVKPPPVTPPDPVRPL